MDTMAPPKLEETFRRTWDACLKAFGGEGASGDNGLKWSIEEDEISNTKEVHYTRFRIESLPKLQGRTVGNVLRRTLLREDLFRCPAAVAFRLRHRSFQVLKIEEGEALSVSPARFAPHEFATVPGVYDSMLDVVWCVQHLTVAEDEAPVTIPLRDVAADTGDVLESWRWSARRCGPCSIQAKDLDKVDSASHYENPMIFPEGRQHLVRVVSNQMVELEVEAVQSTQVEWEEGIAAKLYRQRLLRDGWLMVPPMFSPVKKVNYLITENPKTGEEIVQLEVWSRINIRPVDLVYRSAAALLAAVEARMLQAEAGQFGQSAEAEEEEEEEVEEAEEESFEDPGSVEDDPWDQLLGLGSKFQELSTASGTSSVAVEPEDDFLGLDSLLAETTGRAEREINKRLGPRNAGEDLDL